MVWPCTLNMAHLTSPPPPPHVTIPSQCSSFASVGGVVDMSGVRYLVLDEVDSLLQMGFEQQAREGRGRGHVCDMGEGTCVCDKGGGRVCDKGEGTCV